MPHDNRDGKDKTWCEWVEYTTTHLKEMIYHTVRDRLELYEHVMKCTSCRTKIRQVPNPRSYPKHLEN